MNKPEDITYVVRYFSPEECTNMKTWLMGLGDSRPIVTGWWRQEASAGDAIRYYGPFPTSVAAFPMSDASAQSNK